MERERKSIYLVSKCTTENYLSETLNSAYEKYEDAKLYFDIMVKQAKEYFDMEDAKNENDEGAEDAKYNFAENDSYFEIWETGNYIETNYKIVIEHLDIN